jgi:hypothetical protein
VHTASCSKEFADREIALNAASAVLLPQVSNVEEDSHGFRTVTYREKTPTDAPAIITLIHRRQSPIGVGAPMSYLVLQRKIGSRLFRFHINSRSQC